MQMVKKHNYNYPDEDRQRVREILQLWKLDVLYDILIGNKFKSYYYSY